MEVQQSNRLYYLRLIKIDTFEVVSNSLTLMDLEVEKSLIDNVQNGV